MINNQRSQEPLRGKKLIMLVVIFLFGIFLISFVSPYALSSPRYTQGGFGYSLGVTGTDYSFDSRMCEAGQDFILQIDPFGCSPSVVRSDLLEEQNVHVFCPVLATKINPLIDIEAIDYLTFSKANLPRSVADLGFHPARSALGIKDNLNSPILDNIGYAVIELKRTPREADMPDFVEGNITARVRYDIENAFGIGSASFYLKPLEDDEWDIENLRYNFWDKRGFVRAENVETDSARISVYSGNIIARGEGSYRQKIASFNLKKGQRSRQVYLPTFDYCLGGLEVKLDDVTNPDTTVRLRINADEIEVADGERFLNGRCQIINIKNSGINQEVTISCQEDSLEAGFFGFGSTGSFTLKIIPKISLNIDGSSGGYETGDWLYDFIDDGQKKDVYLAYAYTKGDTTFKEDLKVALVALPEQPATKRQLTDEELSSFKGYVERKRDKGYTGAKILDFALNNFKKLGGYSLELITKIVTGKSFEELGYQEEKLLEDLGGVKIKVEGLATPIDSDIIKGNDDYKKAMQDFDTLTSDFSDLKEKELENFPVYGKRALNEKIDLASKTGQKKTMLDLCEEFKGKYPNANVNEACFNDFDSSSSEISRQSVLVEGDLKEITFKGIYEPNFEEYGAGILIRHHPSGASYSVSVEKNEVVYLDEGEDFIQLIDLEEGFAKVQGKIASRTLAARGVTTNIFTFEKNIPEVVGDYSFTLQKVNLQKVAKVSVIPRINYAETEANFNFRIEIEKRGIQLAPEKIEEKVEKLNKRIEKLEGITTRLGKTVEVMKDACFITGAGLTFKNLVENAQGKGIARQEVMRGDGGWYERCNEFVNNKVNREGVAYKTQDECLIKESDNIDAEVQLVEGILESQQGDIGAIQNQEKYIIQEKKFLKESILNETGIKAEYSGFVSGTLDQAIIDKINSGKDLEDQINLDNIEKAFELGQGYDIEELRKVDLYMRMLNTEDKDLRDSAEKRLYKVLKDVQDNSEASRIASSLQQELSGAGFENVDIRSYGGKESIKGVYTGQSVKGSAIQGASGLVDGEEYPIEIVTYNNIRYLLVLDGTLPNYFIRENGVYKYKGASQGKLFVEKTNNVNEILGAFSGFKKFNKGDYENKFKYTSGSDPPQVEIRFYETEPHVGLPAIVPFDLDDGWYAASKQTLPVAGNIRSYEASGRVNSFYLCNVGENGIEEFYSGIGDDICQLINLEISSTYTVFSGLSESETISLVSAAVDAIEDASFARARNPSLKAVPIRTRRGNYDLPVGSPAVDIPDVKCQDFMSPKECTTLFNVCDPVICPSSRCNLGGAYNVQDVVQSGIIGSSLLCLPNYREKIAVPVCLTGVNEGLKGLNSVQKSYRDCLQENLETGETVGICDEIQSLYICEFVWRQAVPLAKISLSKAVSKISGQGVRGGGEYLNIEHAWQTTSDSIDYFTQSYGINAYNAFKARSTQGIGGAVCKNFISAVGPRIDAMVDAMTEPDSPPQFHGRFDEIPFTDVTVPPVSHYKVFYNIYAGNDRGAYYRVYLRQGKEISFYQDTAFIRNVDSGYIAVGDTASETIDFTAPAGYKEMCIMVNGQEECGFREVSTSFAVDFVRDKYAQEQITKFDIRSEKECISGSASLYNLLTPNVQAAAEGAINPEIYGRGITRICATDNPGQATNPSRWLEVGFCDDPNLKCWLDQESTEDSIKFAGVKNKTVEELQKIWNESIQKDITYDFKKEVEKIEAENDLRKRISLINDLMPKVFFSKEKAKLFFERGKAYAKLSINFYKEKIKELIKAEKVPTGPRGELGEILGEEKGYTSPVFRLVNEDGETTSFKYEFDVWNVMKRVEESVEVGERIYFSELWISVEDAEGLAEIEDTFKGQDKLLITTLKLEEVKNNYTEGLESLVLRTTSFCGGECFLVADNTQLSNDEILEIFDVEDIENIYFNYNDQENKWSWNFNRESVESRNWVAAPEIRSKFDFGGKVEQRKEIPRDIQNLIRSLEGQDFYKGVEIIFEGKGEFIEISNIPTKYDGLIEKYSKQSKVEFNLIKAVIKVESNFDPSAVSSGSAVGLMQLIPGTAREMGLKVTSGICKSSDLSGCDSEGDERFDPEKNIEAGTKYLKLMLNKYQKYGDSEKLALAAYNGGPGTVGTAISKTGKRDDLVTWEDVKEQIKIKETRDYPGKVIVVRDFLELGLSETGLSCGDCGDGFFNSCDEDECTAIGNKLGKQCVWEQRPGWWWGDCREGSLFEIDTIEGDTRLDKEELSKKHSADTSSILIDFLKCMNNEYSEDTNKNLVVTSFTDNEIYSGDCDLSDPNEKYNDDSNCIHKRNSCHYYGFEEGNLKSRAADIRTRGYDLNSIKQVFNQCAKKKGSGFSCVEAGIESDHLHFEINCGCEENKNEITWTRYASIQ